MSAPRLAWVTVAGMLLSTIAGPAVGEYAAFHYVQIGLAVVVAIEVFRRHNRLAEPLSRREWIAFLGASLIWLEAISITEFLSFNSSDFTIFDWMVESSRRGHFGYSPIFKINHFGMHSSFFLLLYVPLYALSATPWWQVVTGPLLIWAGFFPLRRLVTRAVGAHGGILLLAALAWCASVWMGRLANHSFRIEHAWVLAMLWFLVGWMERRTAVWLLAAIALFASKEDGALALGSLAVGHALFDRERRRAASVLLLLSFGFLAIYLPLQRVWIPGGAGYGGYWIAFGDSPAHAAIGMVRHPLQLLTSLATSGLWGFFAPALFLPLFSWRAAWGLAPLVVLLGGATFEPMHALQDYYPGALLPLAIFGLLEVMRGPIGRLGGIIALTLFPIVGYGYSRVLPFSFDTLHEVDRTREVVANATSVCAQRALFPHLGYPPEIFLLDDPACTDDPSSWIVVSSALNPYPLSSEALGSAMTRWKQERRWRAIGVFTVYEPIDAP